MYPRGSYFYSAEVLVSEARKQGEAEARAKDPATALHKAIGDGDAKAARDVMDNVFWNKSDFRPDWLHLFHAVMRDDRDMARMLVTWGATFERDEAKTLARLAGDDWKKATCILKGVGLKTEFSAEEIAYTDHLKMVNMTRHAVRYLPGAAHQQKFSLYLSTAFEDGFAEAVLADNAKQASQLLETAMVNPLAPLDVNNLFHRLADQDIDTAVRFVTKAWEQNFVVKPLILSSDVIEAHPSIIATLGAKHILDDDQRNNRHHIFSDKIKTEDIVAAAPYLYNDRFPVTDEEVRAKILPFYKTPHSHAVGKELLNTEFFKQDGWTTWSLLVISCNDGMEQELKDKFNKLATIKTVQQRPIKSFTKESGYAELKAFSEQGAMKLNAADTIEILGFLQKRSNDGAKIEEARRIITALRDNGSDFSEVDPMQFIGRKDPGVGKVLLDTAIVESKHFDIEILLGKTDKKLQVGTKKGEKGYSYTEFICQLLLENGDSHRYLNMRGKDDVSYQDTFMRDWVDAGKRKITFECERRVPEKKKPSAFSRWTSKKPSGNTP